LGIYLQTSHYMANLSRVLLIGNLTRDPEVSYTPKGTAVAAISLAINRVTGSGDSGVERKEETSLESYTQWQFLTARVKQILQNI
jgi:single-strand DNA-binding protein